jgi:hypothetical protein
LVGKAFKSNSREEKLPKVGTPDAAFLENAAKLWDVKY